MQACFEPEQGFAKSMPKPVYSNQPPRLLTLDVFANLPVYCTLPVYYFGQNLPAVPHIPSSPSI